MPALPELLAPAGNMEKLRTALAYGADAVYLAMGALSLRSKAGFSPQELPAALNLAHARGRRVYLCLNVLAREEHLVRAETVLADLASLSLDGLIIADPGLLDLALDRLPGVPIHLSTQAGASNSGSVRFWSRRGCSRVNLARELSHRDIRAAARACPDMELEVFVHGAMCMAVSGRCLMSAHLNDRPANLGLCAHPCRYEYRPGLLPLEERERPGNVTWEIECEPPFAKVMSPEDLCLLPYLRWFWKTGIRALKIEGRMKSSLYLALVVGAYRAGLDALVQDGFRPDPLMSVLARATTRPLGAGFFLNRQRIFCGPRPRRDTGPVLARIIERLGPDSWLVEAKQAWNSDQDFEVLKPDLKPAPIPAGCYSLEDEEGMGQAGVHPGWIGILRTERPDEPQEDLFLVTSRPWA